MDFRMYMRLLLLFVDIIVTGATVTVISKHKLAGYDVCESDACREIGKAIQRGINYSADPCINFYEYGCGLWPTNNPIPSNEVEWSTDDLQILKINHRAKELFEELNEYDDLPSMRKLKQYYRSCMDEDAIEEQGLKPIIALLDANSGWPIIMEKKSSHLQNLTWQEIDNTYNRMFGGGSFFEISYERDDGDSTRNILTISVEERSFMEDEIEEELDDEDLSDIDLEKKMKVVKAYAKHKGAKIHRGRISRELVELFIFEEKFKEITARANEESLKGLETNKTVMTISELQEYFDLAKTHNATAKIDWLQTIQFIYKKVNVSIDASEPVAVYNIELLHELAYLLDDTPPRVLVNFIQWNIVNEFLPFLNKEMRDIDFEAKYGQYNITEQKPRWQTCVENIPLADALFYLYTRKYDMTNNIKAVTEMTEEIKTTMKERILNSKWTDNSTKKFMIGKMDNLIMQIGSPEWYNNQTALTVRYEGLLVGEHYFKNVLSHLMYEMKNFLIKFRKPADKYEWTESPLVKNAFYDPSTNGIIIPAAEIHDPYFTPGMPIAVNYGAVGMIVGHELAHSFDSGGMQYDEFGNKFSWHTTETNEAYEERVKCYIDQYNDFTFESDEDEEPVQINGLLTKNENIADNVGLEVAFAAFQKRLLTAGPQPKLPGLTNVTDEQLFFLSYVNAWCTTSRATYEESYTHTDPHTPARFRTIGSMANMESFSNAFNCPANSPMNRDFKCSLWK